MNKLILVAIVLIAIGCNKPSEPELSIKRNPGTNKYCVEYLIWQHTDIIYSTYDFDVPVDKIDSIVNARGLEAKHAKEVLGKYKVDKGY